MCQRRSLFQAVGVHHHITSKPFSDLNEWTVGNDTARLEHSAFSGKA